MVFSQTLVNIICCTVKAQLLARPHAEFSTNGPAFTVGQPPSDGASRAGLADHAEHERCSGWSLPDFVVDIVAYFADARTDTTIGSVQDCEWTDV